MDVRPGNHRPRLFIGLGLLGVSWALNWSLTGLRTHLLFFPLWLGYVLAVDAWCEARTGTSAWRRSRPAFLGLFAVSLPAWWLFELFNLRTQNWEYVGREHFGPLAYAVLCSVSFSTVFPAILCTAELLASFRWIERFRRGPRWRWTPGRRRWILFLGAAGLALLLAWPRVFYPLLWVSGVLLLEPLAVALRRPALSDRLAVGDWRGWAALWGAGLSCGFLWEAWNQYSYPRWVYDVPGVEFAYVFEMPLLGYLGYLPFAMEVFLMAGLCHPRLVAGVRGSGRTPERCSYSVLRDPSQG